MEQHLLSAGPLLNEEGNLSEAGYAFSLVKEYDRKAIKAGSLRIKRARDTPSQTPLALFRPPDAAR